MIEIKVNNVVKITDLTRYWFGSTLFPKRGVNLRSDQLTATVCSKKVEPVSWTSGFLCVWKYFPFILYLAWILYSLECNYSIIFRIDTATLTPTFPFLFFIILFHFSIGTGACSDHTDRMYWIKYVYFTLIYLT